MPVELICTSCNQTSTFEDSAVSGGEVEETMRIDLNE